MTDTQSSPFNLELVVEAEHTDELGHLNHAAAVKFMELGREAWYADCGLHDGELGTMGTVVVNINYDYRLECFEGDAVRVELTPRTRGAKSFLLGLKLYRPDGQVAVEGTSTNLVMDMSNRQIVPVPECLACHLSPREG